METMKLFVVTYNDDLTEGRGRSVVLGYTKTKELGLEIVKSPEYAKKYGVWGQPGSKSNVREEEIIIFSDLSEFTGNENHKIIASALAKLTEEEKKALGL